MKYSSLYMVLIIVITFASCTKVIDLKLGNDSGKVVVEGNITNINGLQYIILTKNVPFTNTNIYPPDSGAKITVTDNEGNRYPFIESPTGTYANSILSITPGVAYTMSLVTGGVTYTATSIMPTMVPLDSITSKIDAFTSSQRDITVHYLDPKGVTNQYRFILTVNRAQVNAIFAVNDDFTDGRYVDLDLIETTTNIFPGDTVNVEMQCIDKPIYTYWFSLMQQEVDGPGGGVAPSNPPTNITPAALGYFSAHTTQTKMLVVK